MARRVNPKEDAILDEIERLARRGGSHAEFSELFDELDEVTRIYPFGRKGKQEWHDEDEYETEMYTEKREQS